MALRNLRPITPGQRGASVPDFEEITRQKPEKSLVRPINSKGGRNATGRVTMRHQGGGHKRAYRLIDFVRNDKDGVPAKVAQIEYDPNRTANIANEACSPTEACKSVGSVGCRTTTRLSWFGDARIQMRRALGIHQCHRAFYNLLNVKKLIFDCSNHVYQRVSDSNSVVTNPVVTGQINWWHVTRH